MSESLLSLAPENIENAQEARPVQIILSVF